MEHKRSARATLLPSVTIVSLALAGCASTGSQSAAPQTAAQPQPASGYARVNAEADQTAAQVNTDVVGAQQQRRNEAIAEAPRDANGHVVLTGQAQGHAQTPQGQTSLQGPTQTDRVQPPAQPQPRAEGTTSMQPGEEPTGQPPPPPANPNGSGFGAAVRDVTRATDQPGHYTPAAIEWNPLGLFVGGRLSFNAEWAPATHHVLTLSPYFVHTSADIALSGSETASQSFTGVGTELGYRYYTGHRGMNGVFVGPSLITGMFNAGLPGGNQFFTDVGVAADVGVQEIFFNHLVVGGGAGIEYLSVSHDFEDLPTAQSTIASSGLKPRLLLEAGYGF